MIGNLARETRLPKRREGLRRRLLVHFPNNFTGRDKASTRESLEHRRGADVAYNDPYFPKVGRGRKYNLQMTCAPLEKLSQYDCALIVTDHSDYDYKKIVQESKLVVDSRNATKGIESEKIVHC